MKMGPVGQYYVRDFSAKIIVSLVISSLIFVIRNFKLSNSRKRFLINYTSALRLLAIRGLRTLHVCTRAFGPRMGDNM